MTPDHHLPVLLINLLFCVLQWHRWRGWLLLLWEIKSYFQLHLVCHLQNHQSQWVSPTHTLFSPVRMLAVICDSNLFLYLYFVSSLTTAERFDLPIPSQMDTYLFPPAPKNSYWKLSIANSSFLAARKPCAGVCGVGMMECYALWVWVLVIHSMAKMRIRQNILFLTTASERKTYLNKKRRENYCLGKED